MLVNDMIGNYQQISQHQSAPIDDSQSQAVSNVSQAQTEKNKPQGSQASVVSISFEAQMIQKQAEHIMVNYDLTNISQNKLDELTEKLVNNEVINSQQYAVLSFNSEQIFEQTDNPEQGLKISPDQPQNMLENWQQKLDDHKSRHVNSLAIKQTQGIVNLLTNLQASKDFV
ncbi:hypothetical protein HR060_17295 [Catenovulum sp. SM1970]|uniref:hypothetical protein n=1 Tax=Marinifaba aquimaris TaxID=2741323 RepID=UPI0015719F48|nr:hypothetical protein [Marinifaba aquimaris]NTS78601.1 hypothetical protein [Marinifaba aquimaris]